MKPDYQQLATSAGYVVNSFGRDTWFQWEHPTSGRKGQAQLEPDDAWQLACEDNGLSKPRPRLYLVE